MSEISEHTPDEKLLRMAAQIATFFRSQPGELPEVALAGHINDFWGYRMRTEYLALVRAGAVTDPVLRAAAPLIRLPGEPTEGVAPNDRFTHMNEAEAES